MLNRPLSLFLWALKGLRDFKALDVDDREIVFYSEDNASRVFFEPIIKELLETHEKTVCYLTSSADDPVLTRPTNQIRGFYIGSGLVRTYLSWTLKASILIMTMPDLETYYFKRSKVMPVHYIYVFHALTSTSMVYRSGAFDHFNALFCVGPYHVKEIRANEKLYNLKPKNLIESGYGRLDSIIEQAQYCLQTVGGDGKKKVLVAPSWGDHTLLETCAIELVSILLKNGYQVVYRPHPMTVRHRRKLLAELNLCFEGNGDFSYETQVGSQESLHSSDIMISDWSGTAIEYAFGLERPVIFIDLPRKINNSEYEEISIEPFEVTIRSKIGSVIPTSRLEDIPKHIEALCSNPDSFKQEIRKIRSENVYNVGTSGAVGAAYIVQTVEKLRGTCEKKC
jgi:YidC/Oxa1 family membrane protein insertase